jgi:hypothetical protein
VQQHSSQHISNLHSLPFKQYTSYVVAQTYIIVYLAMRKVRMRVIFLTLHILWTIAIAGMLLRNFVGCAYFFSNHLPNRSGASFHQRSRCDVRGREGDCGGSNTRPRRADSDYQPCRRRRYDGAAALR